ncbi:hypothetical protein PIROE2DRAFT_60912 [Piromyces sp. E2]|nr:hypothetical protein PIROE2DRAFT_60912 [Piromyces sp. E2]|eukprot:OUM64094.1 hypothetical protein PIROE2DRAFT_60912 [Piromyces sp. E2]
MVTSLDYDINLFLKISRKIDDEIDNLDEKDMKNLFITNNIQLKELNNQDFDVLIYAIIYDLSSDYIKFLINEGEFKNLNYTFTITQKFKNYLDMNESDEEDEDEFDPLLQIMIKEIKISYIILYINILKESLSSENCNLIVKALHYEMPYMNYYDLKKVIFFASNNDNIKVGLIQFFNISLEEGNMKNCQDICGMVDNRKNNKKLINDILFSITKHAFLSKCNPQFLSLLLNIAIKINNKRYVSSLIENSKINLDVNLKDKSGNFPLFTALYQSHSNNTECDIFCYLIDHGANINIKDEEGISLLVKALEKKKYKALNYILKQPFIIDLDINESYSPLIKAIYLNHPETVKSLLQKTNSNEPTTIKRTCIRYKESPFKPLVLAYLLDRKDIFSLLINYNSSSVNFLDSNGYSILHYAILKEDHAMVKQLIAKGANPNVNIHEVNLLEIVMALENKALFSILISNTNLKVNQPNSSSETPLISLLKMNSKFFRDKRFKKDGVKELIRKGAKVNVTDENGKSALVYAIEEEDEYYCYDITELLLNGKANPNFLVEKDIPDCPRFEEFRIINEQLYEYCDVIQLSNGTPMGRPPLYYATKKNNLPLVKLLIEKGADPLQVVSYAFYREGNALRYAAELGRLEIFKYLLEVCEHKIKEKDSTRSKRDEEDLIGILFCCILSQQTEIYEYLLDKKFKEGDIFPTKLLKMILKSCNADFVYILIRKVFILDLSQARNESQELLLYCMEHFYMSIISFLVKNGVNPRAIINNEFYKHILVHDFDLEFFKCLVDHGLDINYSSREGYTFLYYAIFEGKINMIEYLIEQGANLNARCIYGSLSDVNKYFNKSGSLYNRIEALLNSRHN